MLGADPSAMKPSHPARGEAYLAALRDVAGMGCGEVEAEDREGALISHAFFLASFLELPSNQRVNVAQRGHIRLVPVWCLGLMSHERNQDCG